jgi:hypothetical protein
MQRNLGFGDGFMFGCGFMAAGVVAWIVMVIVFAILGLIMSLLGVGILEGLGDIGSLFLPLV